MKRVGGARMKKKRIIIIDNNPESKLSDDSNV